MWCSFTTYPTNESRRHVFVETQILSKHGRQCAVDFPIEERKLFRLDFLDLYHNYWRNKKNVTRCKLLEFMPILGQCSNIKPWFSTFLKMWKMGKIKIVKPVYTERWKESQDCLRSFLMLFTKIVKLVSSKLL